MAIEVVVHQTREVHLPQCHQRRAVAPGDFFRIHVTAQAMCGGGEFRVGGINQIPMKSHGCAQAHQVHRARAVLQAFDLGIEN